MIPPNIMATKTIVMVYDMEAMPPRDPDGPLPPPGPCAACGVLQDPPEVRLRDTDHAQHLIHGRTLQLPAPVPVPVPEEPTHRG